MTAARIQRLSTPGWRTPPGTVVVARNGRTVGWGNPYRTCRTGYADEPYDWEWDGHTWLPVGDSTVSLRNSRQAVDMYRELVLRTPRYVVDARTALAGRDLACWCPVGAPCHADVLLLIASGESW